MGKKNYLKGLGPSPEACKLIPKGEFKDSALVYIEKWKLNSKNKRESYWDVIPRGDHGRGRKIMPAPTLEEILRHILRYTYHVFSTFDAPYSFFIQTLDYASKAQPYEATEAALNVWRWYRWYHERNKINEVNDRG